MDAARLRVWAAVLSGGAALMHTFQVEEHLSEWWGYGLFFVFAAVAQAFYAVLLLLRPWRGKEPRARDDALERAWYWAGVAGNALLVLLYVVTRTTGIPFFGPEAGQVEAWTAAGILDKLVELGVIAALLRLLYPPPAATGAARGPAGTP